MNKDRLYDLIDKDDDMTDEEKREAYFSEIENYESEQSWMDEQ
jgi:hypothetical protein